MIKQFGFLKTTAIGGLLFLLPLIVIGALVGQVVPIVIAVAEFLRTYLPTRTPAGIALLFLAAVAILILLCFAAGLIARRSIGRKLSENFEKNLLMFFPRYAIIKDQMAGQLGGEDNKAAMKPVVVRFSESARIGFELERAASDQVAVYLPGSPDPWTGHVALVATERVHSLDLPFPDAVAIFEQLGRGAVAAASGPSGERS